MDAYYFLLQSEGSSSCKVYPLVLLLHRNRRRSTLHISTEKLSQSDTIYTMLHTCSVTQHIYVCIWTIAAAADLWGVLCSAAAPARVRCVAVIDDVDWCTWCVHATWYDDGARWFEFLGVSKQVLSLVVCLNSQLAGADSAARLLLLAWILYVHCTDHCWGRTTYIHVSREYIYICRQYVQFRKMNRCASLFV